MDSSLKLTLLSALLCANAALAAEPPSADQVRAELDRQLREMVESKSSPPEVQLHFVGLEDSAAYKLVEVHFTLDGEPLQVSSTDELGTPGPHVLASRQVAEGPHTLVSNVVYMDASWSLFSQTSGFLWNMTSTLNFQAQRGLKVHVKALSVLVPDAKDPRLKVKLVHDVSAEMTAKLDDGTMPEPVSRHSSPPDAGVVARNTPPEPPKTTPWNPEPPPVTPPQAQKARLLVRALVQRKPVAATLSVRGATAPQKLALKKGAKAPTQLEMVPGEYTVDLIAPGFLAQTRRIQLSGGNPTSLDFQLVRAPKKKLVKESNDRIELQKPLSFAEGQAAPKPATLGLLPQLVDLLVQRPIRRIRIEAHTDNKEGQEGSRQQLAEARARAVADLLVRAGLEPARIETAGFGDTRPKAPNFTPGGRELNRRVEFIILER